MTARQFATPVVRTKQVVRVIPGAWFPTPPAVGDHFLWPTGRSVLEVTRVRRVIGERGGERWRLFGIRMRLTAVPAGITPRPWPQKAAPAPSRAPQAAAMPLQPAQRDALAAQRRAKRAEALVTGRKRAVDLLRDDRRPDRPVPLVRIDNASARVAEWRDPDDMAPNRRTAKIVRGYRARDSIQTLEDSGSINKSHARAARRFRRDYELGEIGLRPSRNLLDAPSGFAAGGGPSETRLLHLAAYRATVAALHPHLVDVVLSIVIHNNTASSYALKRRLNTQAVVGYILACLDLLSDHYKRIDDDKKESGPAD